MTHTDDLAAFGVDRLTDEEIDFFLEVNTTPTRPYTQDDMKRNDEITKRWGHMLRAWYSTAIVLRNELRAALSDRRTPTPEAEQTLQKWLRHLDGCKHELCGDTSDNGYPCNWSAEVHTKGWVAAPPHEFKAQGCTCGLDAALSNRGGGDGRFDLSCPAKNSQLPRGVPRVGD